MLEISNLFVKVAEKNLLNNFSLNILDGEVHAIMGPNGIGKSSLCKVIMKDSNYSVTSGDIIFDNNNLKDLKTFEVARLGIMYISQNPLEIEGVSNAECLRTALKEKNNQNVNIFEFNKEMEEACDKLCLDRNFIHRDVNFNCSGGEKKKVELLHMAILKPKFVILDEIDSGLDVDALKIVTRFINDYKEKEHASILIITHHTNILDYITPDYVHILKNGSIERTGDLSLAKKIENEGFSSDN